MARRVASEDPPRPMTIPEFHKALDRISHSHSRYENFRNFIEAAYCALARRTALSRARSDALEEGLHAGDPPLLAREGSAAPPG